MADKVHVIAHSMGNRALLGALERILDSAESRDRLKLGQVFLAAPDVIDSREFLLQAKAIGKYVPPFDRATLYASNGDKALYTSQFIHEHPRAGYYYPFTVTPGIDTIAVPKWKSTDFFGHGHFADAEDLHADMYDLMHRNADPRFRRNLQIAKKEDGRQAKGVWCFCR